jgi:ectoine hydroxylase-related dioxygenase (phytanoyl-CoA dioxygenase family)
MLGTLNEWPGFEIREDVIPKAECDRLIESIGRSDSFKGKAGVRHLMSVSAVREIAADDRLRSIAEIISGRAMIPYKATLFEKTGKANWLVAWHQDTALPLTAIPDAEGWGPATIKDGVVYAHAPTRALSQVIALRLHLDASTELNGPLRVIPNSHCDRLLSVPEHPAAEARSIRCLVGKGGVIAMSPLTVHASSK